MIENANEGIDTVYSTIDYSLTANVENLVLQGTASLQGYGNSLSNSTATAGTTSSMAAPADSMIGGAGNDFYVVDNALDVVTEAASEGTDAVQASVTYTLSNNVENLTLTGSANINGTGNSLANAIAGNSGNNILDGGAGADAASGGTGNDTYVVDNAGDTVTENAGGGTDVVQASVTYRSRTMWRT